jgi:thiamine pyrophosphokinase
LTGIEQLKQAAIFLNGAYPTAHHDFYGAAIDAAKGRGMVVSVDGALQLFHDLGKIPDLLLGDFDSVDTAVLQEYSSVQKITHPVNKDATDGELAVRYVLDQGCDQIEIFGAFDTSFESDQMLANVFLLALVSDRRREMGQTLAARLVDHRQEIFFLDDGDLQLAGIPGDGLSIIPISRSARVTLRGTKWELTDQLTRLGSSWTLRNHFAREAVEVAIGGRAVIVHRRTGTR